MTIVQDLEKIINSDNPTVKKIDILLDRASERAELASKEAKSLLNKSRDLSREAEDIAHLSGVCREILTQLKKE